MHPLSQDAIHIPSSLLQGPEKAVTESLVLHRDGTYTKKTDEKIVAISLKTIVEATAIFFFVSVGTLATLHLRK